MSNTSGPPIGDQQIDPNVSPTTPQLTTTAFTPPQPTLNIITNMAEANRNTKVSDPEVSPTQWLSTLPGWDSPTTRAGWGNLTTETAETTETTEATNTETTEIVKSTGNTATVTTDDMDITENLFSPSERQTTGITETTELTAIPSDLTTETTAATKTPQPSDEPKFWVIETTQEKKNKGKQTESLVTEA